MSVRIGNTIVAGMPEKAMRGVGDIFTTTNKGVIAGAVEANGGSYNIADYNSGTDSVASKLTAGMLPYVSKAEFQTQVANTGACDSFGWNGAASRTLYAWLSDDSNYTVYTNTPEKPTAGATLYNVDETVNQGFTVVADIEPVKNQFTATNTNGDMFAFTRNSTLDTVVNEPDPTFLVPKLNPWHVGKSAPVVGNGMTLGLTDGTNNTGLYYSGNSTMTYRPDVFGKPAGTSDSGSAPTTAVSLGVTTDGTKSGMVADLSETTNRRVMVQLATGATDEALETCTSVLSDVSALKYDYVVDFQAPTATNNYTWYRKYKSGWVEQGGVFDAPNNATGVEKTITLPLPMTNDKYTTTIGVHNNSNDSSVYLFVASKTSTTITFKMNVASTALADQNWQVSGMAA